MKSIEFKVKTSTGKEFTTFAKNLTEAQNNVIDEIDSEEGAYLEILGDTQIHRITRQEGAKHWQHPGYLFNSVDMLEAFKRDISLFKIR